MGKSGGAKQPVVDYYMSMHWRIAHPVDALLAIYVGEKEAWTGEVTAETAIPINKPALFGGNKKEGGVLGTAHFFPGGPTQVMPEHLAARLGLTTATCPGYRQLSSIFFHGAGVSATAGTPSWFMATGGLPSRDGFLWASNNPYLKSIWAKVRCAPKGLNPAIAMIGPNANPIHIIYEILTSAEWGQGGAPSGIKTAAFEAAAQTIFDEGFGLSLAWMKQADVESFVSEVLDHIHATVFVDPSDGLMTIKLIRGDYDIEDLPILNADNCKVTQFDRKAWGETVNEIVVTWTNPENEGEETVAAQNNANIAIQGGTISDSRNYYGVRSADLAQKLAFRDLAMSSWPLALVELEVDRSAWSVVPGGCVRLQYPEYGIDDIVLRVSKVDYGKPGSASIKLSTIEDIFSLASAAFDASDGTQWEDPSADPAAAGLTRIMTAPAFFVAQELSPADAGTFEYPEVLPILLVSTDNTDTNNFDLYGMATLANGDSSAELIGSRPTLGHSVLPVALPAEASSLLETFGAVIGGPGPRPSGFVFIGNVAEQAHEIALIESFDDDGWLLRRGVLDTVPRAWPDGTSIWFVSTDSKIVVDTTVYSASETVNLRVAPSTSRGTLSFTAAPILAATLSGRPHLPLRPSNVKVEGVGFGSINLSSTSPANVNVTWSNRNRESEDLLVLGWDEGSVTPEAGQTTTIKLLSTAGTVLATHAGISGTSFAVPAASWGDQTVADIAVYAERDGLLSLQSHRIRVKIRPGGWGDDWGNDWGGGDSVDIGEPDPGSAPPDPTPVPPDAYPDLPPWTHCPIGETPVLLANATRDGPGERVRADALKVGDIVWTQHETTMQWGAWPVTAVSIARDQEVVAAPGLPTVTGQHRFWIDGAWIRAHALARSAGRADVVKITVAEAHTYITFAADGTEVLSHNIKDEI